MFTMTLLSLIVVCLFLVLLTILIHTIGTTLWVQTLLGKYTNHEGIFGGRDRFFIFITTTLVLMLMHTVEVLLWAVALLKLPRVTQVETFEQAFFFSVVQRAWTTGGGGFVPHK